ncbi:MAG: serine/threonine-protein kinase [Kofleriaceae bacterium]|nr:serine/threonine-protein kinase [Kofleriaceae bacterium]
MPREGDSDPFAETSVPEQALAETLASSDAPPAVTDTAVDGTRRPRVPFDTASHPKIGRFVVLEQLGQGGMGVVLAAFDPQLDRRVAIKMLHDHVSESHGARLVREAKAMAQLAHPNVLTVHETGQYGDRLYIAMELVDGQTLGAWLRAQPRTHEQIFEYVMQAGQGLAAAHAAGLVHRDFKPDNVLVGKDGRVRVSDFGLVSSTGEATPVGSLPDARSPSALTQAGAVMGTPLYMAPEQHRGQVADAKADQFSFCVTLWQALCDELPYGADTYEQLVDNVTLGKLRAIPRGVRVSAKVRAILQRGLAADPKERFPSMQALLAALERARRPARWPWLAGGAALLAAGGVALAFGLASSERDPCSGSRERVANVWNTQRKNALEVTFTAAQGRDIWEQLVRDLDRYTDTWATRHREVCRATHVRGEQSADLLDLRMRCLDGRLAELDALLARFGDVKRDTLFKAVDAAATLGGFADCDDAERLRAAVPLPTDAATRARIADLEHAYADAASYDKTGQWAKAKEIIDPLVGQARLTGYGPLEAKLVLLRAGLEYRSGDLATAAASYREAAEAAARARDDARLAQSWIDLMNVLAASGKVSDALALEPIAKTSAERVSDQPRLGARFANVLAGLYLATGKYPDARVQYEKALALVRKDGPDSDLLGHALLNFGIALWYTGDLDGAKQHFEDARDRFIAKLGPRHPSLGYVFRNLGDLAVAKQDIDTALASYQRAYEILEGAHGPEHIDVAIALEPLSYAYARKGDAAKARAAGEKALAIREHKFGPDHPTIANTLNSLADAEVADGSAPALARAITYLERSIAIQDKTYGPEHPKTPESLDRLGTAQEKAGNVAAAIAAYQRSVAIRTKLAPASPELQATQAELARLLRVAR